MSNLLIVVARIGLLLLLLTALKVFQWPDISNYLSFIQDGVNRLYFMNVIMDMDTAFTITKWILTIELTYLAYRILIGIISFVGGGGFDRNQSDSTNT